MVDFNKKKLKLNNCLPAATSPTQTTENWACKNCLEAWKFGVLMIYARTMCR